MVPFRPRHSVFLLLLLVFLAPPPASAQPGRSELCLATRWPIDRYHLALSGGGYRAMLFHLGALKRLNEHGLLPCMHSASSVSGGSILAGLLAVRWRQLKFNAQTGVAENFDEIVTTPILALATTTIIDKSVLGAVSAYWQGSNVLKKAYAKLFGDAGLGDLPDTPKFLFNAVNFGSREIWTFSKERMGDEVFGFIGKPQVTVAEAVAASSAFPPFLSPLKLTPKGAWVPGEKTARHPIDKITEARKTVLLTDGGVKDNLGLTAIFGYPIVLASDAGLPATLFASPTDWRDQIEHVVDIAHRTLEDAQVNALLKKFRKVHPDGVYLTSKQLPRHQHDVDTPWGHWGVSEGNLIADTQALATFPTQLSSIRECDARRLVNFGYFSLDYYLPYSNSLWTRTPEGTFWENVRGQKKWKLSRSLPFGAEKFGEKTGSKCAS